MQQHNSLVHIIVVALLCMLFSPADLFALRILIDPGHDRQSPSVRGCACDVPEYVFNHYLSKIIGDALANAPDVSMAYTHGLEDCLSLRGRARATLGYDLFISVHHDAAQDRYLKPVNIQGRQKRCVTGPSGFCIYVSEKNPYPEASKAFARMLSEIMIREGFSPSTHHGENIPGERHIMISPGVYAYDNLIVLKEARCPAILIEAAVLTNPDDEMQAVDPEFQLRVADAVREAVEAYTRTAKVLEHTPQDGRIGILGTGEKKSGT